MEHLESDMPDSQRYPLNLHLINNVEDNVVFWLENILILIMSQMFSTTKTWKSNSYFVWKKILRRVPL